MRPREAHLTAAIRLRKEHLDAMIAHALEEAPNECCGLVAAKDGAVAAVHRATNKEQSPYRFSIDGMEQRRLEEAIEEAGDELAGFYHSHTGSEARPSPTDIRMMGPFFGPPYVHFVVGIKDRANPVVRVFYIKDGDSEEQEYETIREPWWRWAVRKLGALSRTALRPIRPGKG